LILWEIWTTDPLRSIGALLVPVSLLLTLQVWRESGWELRGTWWGMLPVAAGFALSVLRTNFAALWIADLARSGLLPVSLSLYLYASGVILLVAGAHIWRKAWFPLALLLSAQPVPALAVHWFDLPLQELSAHIARAFASLIGFPPTNPQLLRLMFTPDFGMFIAPGCDGMRGAVTLGYVALIAGYLKRVPVPRWIAYVTGAMLLGHLFNLMRLCALVLYYRMAVGHAYFESSAKQADYLIGGSLFVLATLLFLWVFLWKEEKPRPDSARLAAGRTARATPCVQTNLRLAAFAALALLFAVPGARGVQTYRKSLAAAVRGSDRAPQILDELLPKQLGDYHLARSWQEQLYGVPTLETGVYSNSSAYEITLGVWLPLTPHSVFDSWKVRGEEPELRSPRSFETATRRIAVFDSAFYSDGVTDSFSGNTYCTPTSCSTSPFEDAHRRGGESNTGSTRAVPIFFRIERPHANVAESITMQEFAAEARRFLVGVDFADLSEKFQ
jgi:exosortase J